MLNSAASRIRPLVCITSLCGLLWCLGTLGAAGASEGSPTVELWRDRWGTPHIFAATEEAGFFGLGYACADDRMLQMDLVRRRASGRLSEVFGKEAVDSDRAARIAGHTQYALAAVARLPREMQSWLAAYAAGVNAWAAAHPQVIARRFKPLGAKPEPWTPADCLLAARGVLSLGSPFRAAPVEAYHRFRESVATVGEAEAMRQHFRMVLDDEAAIVSEAEMAKDAKTYGRLKSMPRMAGFDPRVAPGEGPKMSHAWAVSGSRSRTGKPILESDPQLPLSTPPFLYEFHLAAGRIDARGVGLPGLPGLFIGFNRHIAWGNSALGTDATVVFIDRLGSDGKSYLFKEKPVPFERRLELIRVKGAPAVVQEVLANRHGTVFNALLPQPRSGEAYVLHDPQTLENGSNIPALVALMSASDWKEFRAAWEHYYDPGLHTVYADAGGNLGYHTVVNRPLTARSPRMAQEGWTGAGEITGRIPFGDLPHMWNPTQGFVSHANNMPAGSWYPYDLGIITGGNGHTDRSLRLIQLLSGDRRFSVEEFENVVHRDDLNAAVAALLPVARKVAQEDQVTDPAVLGALKATEGWDMRAGSSHGRPGVRALENALGPYRGAGLQEVYGAGGGGIAHLARRLGTPFARDGRTPQLPAVRRYLLNWLRGAGGDAGAAAGRERTSTAFETGRTIRIPYQRTSPLDLPVVDASLDIVSPPLTCLDRGTIWSQPGNLYTHIVDLADVDNSRAMIAPGNSEDAESPYRTAGIGLWVKGETRAAPLSRRKIEQLGVTKTTLEVQPYRGAGGPKTLTVEKADGAVQFVPAIPPAPPATAASEPRPMPGRKPDDPRLEALFRVMLRQGTPPEDVDEGIAECRALVKASPALREQLLSAARLGVYLIEESAAGRLKVRYGSPHALKRLRELLDE